MEKLDSLKKTRTLALLVGGVIALQALINLYELSNGMTPKISAQWLMAQLDLILQNKFGNYFLVVRELLISSLFLLMALLAHFRSRNLFEMNIHD